MIAAVGAAAVVAGTVVPAHAAPEAADQVAAITADAQDPERDEYDQEDPNGAFDEEDVPDPVADTGTWKQDANGWKYVWPDGTFPHNEAGVIGGQVYRFDAEGYMRTGWVKEDGAWYYHTSSGAQASGWVAEGGRWYYLDPVRCDGHRLDARWRGLVLPGTLHRLHAHRLGRC